MLKPPEIVLNSALLNTIERSEIDPLERQRLDDLLKGSHLNLLFVGRGNIKIRWLTEDALTADDFNNQTLRGISMMSDCTLYASPKTASIKELGTKNHPLETGASPYTPAAETLKIGAEILALKKIIANGGQEHLEAFVSDYSLNQPQAHRLTYNEIMDLTETIKTSQVVYYKINDNTFGLNADGLIIDESGQPIVITRR